MSAWLRSSSPDVAGPSVAGPRAGTSTHRADIQALRGLAVLLVVAFHSDTFVGGGFIGVDVFFVISGFVIMASLLRELHTSGTVDLRAFYVRRIRRLLPALGLMILAVVLLSGGLLGPAGGRQAVAETARSASLFSANLHLESSGDGYFALAADRNPLLHTWSLSLEEQFYAVLPVLTLAAWAWGRRGGRPVHSLRLALTFVTVASFGWAAWVVDSGDLRAAFYLPHLRAWEFGVGALLAIRAGRLASMPRAVVPWVARAGAAMIVVAALTLAGTSTFPGPIALLPVVGAALVIAAGTAAERPAANWLVWLGDRSYSWYLWHWPLLTFAAIRWPDASWARLGGAAVALVPAALSYSLIEQPIRIDRRIVGMAAVTVALIGVTLPVASAAVVERTADDALERTAPELAVHTALWTSDCDDLPWPADRCTFGRDQRGGETLAIFGDSHAMALGDVVTLVADELGMQTVAFTKPGCAAVLVPDAPPDGCTRWRRAALDRIEDIDPAIVVIANRSPLYVHGRVDDDRTGHVREPLAPTSDEALSFWGAGLRAMVTSLDRPVLIIQTVPEHPARVADLIGTAVDDTDVPALSIEAHLERTGPVGAEERKVVGTLARATTVDPADVLCADICAPRVDGRWRYLDSNHVTPEASLLLADQVRDRIAALLTGALDRTNR